jgi:leader peptidase (prepilin peptidase) / N-methyltransferase
MAIVGSALIAFVWYRDGRGGAGWQGLLTALVGMAASGGLVWAVRVVCSAVLQREAMGFGDVTLMAMIGAFLGWQPCLIIFFLAPFAGLVLGLLRLILFREREIPYGPFLCLASLAVIVGWNTVWNSTEHVFAMGWLVPAAVVVCLALMAGMLGAWRLILNALR